MPANPGSIEPPAGPRPFPVPSKSPEPALQIPVLFGTVRDGRRSIRLAHYVHARLSARLGIESRFVDPADLGLGNLVAREFEIPEAQRPAALVEFVHAMEAADAFVIVTPEYNYSFPGALKNLLDVTFRPWNRKPFGLVGTGGISGGLRAIDSLRQVVSGLGAVTVPAHLGVQFVGQAFNADGNPAHKEDLDRRLDKFLDEVEWYARALRPARLVAGGPGPR